MRSRALVLAALLPLPAFLAAPVFLVGCAGPPPPEPDPAGAVPADPWDLRVPARAVREAVENLLGAPVPEEASAPVLATQRDLEAAVAQELRPQVERLHPGATPGARETLLLATARSSSRSVVARWSPERRRILLAPENVPSSLEAAGLPGDPATVRAFLTLVLAHEMVHAADDAAHGLAGLFLSAPDSEAVRALGMVVEGRAVHYARRAAERLGLPPEVAGVLPGAKGEMDERRARFLLSYREGAAFAAALEARGGAALAARPLSDPPRFTATLFHPGRYGPSGEEPVPDLVPPLAAAGFAGAGAASELDLRARWLPKVGEEGVARAFEGFLAGAGIHRADGGVSVSLHATADRAAAYAEVLRSLYGMAPGAAEGSADGLAVVVLVEGRAVASAVAPDPDRARREAGAALGAAR